MASYVTLERESFTYVSFATQGINDAPIDGKTRGRKDGGWHEVPEIEDFENQVARIDALYSKDAVLTYGDQSIEGQKSLSSPLKVNNALVLVNADDETLINQDNNKQTFLHGNGVNLRSPTQPTWSSDGLASDQLALQSEMNTKTEEAPKDGSFYARVDGGWKKVEIPDGAIVVQGADTIANILDMDTSEIKAGYTWLATDDGVLDDPNSPHDGERINVDDGIAWTNGGYWVIVGLAGVDLTPYAKTTYVDSSIQSLKEIIDGLFEGTLELKGNISYTGSGNFAVGIGDGSQILFLSTGGFQIHPGTGENIWISSDVINAGERLLSNLKEPINPSDAVTKSFLEDVVNNGWTEVWASKSDEGEPVDNVELHSLSEGAWDEWAEFSIVLRDDNGTGDLHTKTISKDSLMFISSFPLPRPDVHIIQHESGDYLLRFPYGIVGGNTFRFVGSEGESVNICRIFARHKV